MIKLCCFMDFILISWWQAMQAGFPHVFPTDSKELSSTQKPLMTTRHQCDLKIQSRRGSRALLPLWFHRYRWEWTGQQRGLEKTACIDTHVACTSSNVACSSVNVARHGGTWWKEILFLETDSEARDIGHDTGWHGQTHAPDVDKVQTWQAMCANPE